MKSLWLTSFLTMAGAASSVLLPVFNAAGQVSVTTAPVGYLQTQCLSNSDTLVAPPFTRPAAFVGAVSSISGSTVAFSSPGFTAGQYSAPTTTDTYYLRIGPTTATLTGTLTVTSGSTTVTGSGTTFGTDVQVGDRITINDGYNLLTYTVTAIASTTSLTIDRAYSDSAATGSAVVAGQPTAVKATTAKTTAVKTTTVSKGATTTTVAKSAATTASGASSLSGLSATFDHSPYEGRFYQVTTNDTGSVTVNLNGDTLATVAVGTQVSIIPYWTLNSIFPAANAGVSFTATTSTHQLQTQVLVPNFAGVGTNLAAAATYFYYSNGTNVGWRLFGDLTTDQSNVPMLPDGYFTVRNPSTAPALPVTFSGAVPINKLVTMLSTNSSQGQDNAVALTRPADATLNTLGLYPTDGSFVATTTTHSIEDQLLVYDNTTAVINKSASATYFYYNNGTNVGWRLFGDLTTDQGNVDIPAGSALLVRKAATTSGQTFAWTNLPNY